MEDPTETPRSLYLIQFWNPWKRRWEPWHMQPVDLATAQSMIFDRMKIDAMTARRVVWVDTAP